MGAINKYTTELGEEIAHQIATSSKSLKTICSELDICHRTLFNWIADDKHPMFHLYTRAKEMQADFLAEEMIDIADDGSNDFMTITKGDQTYEVENKEWTSRSKLRVEARKWAASKLKPKKYGDKLDLTSYGEKLPTSINIILDNKSDA